MKILVVDDDINIIESIKKQLKTHDIYYVTNTIDIYKSIKKKCYDLILLDLKIEREKSGIEIIKELKRINWNGSIILMTGYTDILNNEETEYVKVATKCMIYKPFTKTYINEIVNKIQ